MFRRIRLLAPLLLAGAAAFLTFERLRIAPRSVAEKKSTVPTLVPDDTFEKKAVFPVRYEEKMKDKLSDKKLPSIDPVPLDKFELPQLGELRPIPLPKPPPSQKPQSLEMQPRKSPSLEPLTINPIPLPMPNVRYLNQPRLAVSFEVLTRGPSGISAVELWATRDRKDWSCIARKEGSTSPIYTTLPDDGVYHLKLAFVAGNGKSSGMPSAKDEPEEWVVLDTTPPQVSLHRIQPFEGEGAVSIRWQAGDANLDDRPIKLEWSRDSREWLPVSDWIANSGFVNWMPPANAPASVYFRITARDKAGNEAEARTPKPVNIDTVIPTGKVTGIVDYEELPLPRAEK